MAIDSTTRPWSLRLRTLFVIAAATLAVVAAPLSPATATAPAPALPLIVINFSGVNQFCLYPDPSSVATPGTSTTVTFASDHPGYATLRLGAETEPGLLTAELPAGPRVQPQ